MQFTGSFDGCHLYRSASMICFRLYNTRLSKQQFMNNDVEEKTINLMTNYMAVSQRNR